MRNFYQFVAVALLFSIAGPGWAQSYFIKNQPTDGPFMTFGEANQSLILSGSQRQLGAITLLRLGKRSCGATAGLTATDGNIGDESVTNSLCGSTPPPTALMTAARPGLFATGLSVCTQPGAAEGEGVLAVRLHSKHGACVVDPNAQVRIGADKPGNRSTGASSTERQSDEPLFVGCDHPSTFDRSRMREPLCAGRWQAPVFCPSGKVAVGLAVSLGNDLVTGDVQIDGLGIYCRTLTRLR